MSNPITIVGTIATEPRRIVTQSGVALCTFRIASGERRYDRTQQKWVDGETNWYGVSAFRALGEHALESFRKGERVLINGRLRIRNWENPDGRSGLSVEIEADAIGHDVRWGVSRFEKRTGAAEGDEASAAAASAAAPVEPAAESPEGDGFIPLAA